jgi:predicted  nucleic acid-binding Zn-ribbon protein
MSAVLEARAVITATDDTKGAFAAVERHLVELSSAAKRAGQAVPNSAMKELAAESAKLDRAFAKLGEFKGLQAGLAKARSEFNAATQQARALSDLMKAAGEPSAKMQREYARAQAEASRSAKNFEAEKNALLAAKRGIEEAIGPIASVGSAEMKLGAEIARVSAAMEQQRNWPRRSAGRSTSRNARRMSCSTRACAISWRKAWLLM